MHWDALLKQRTAGAHLAEVVRLSPPGSAAPASAPLTSSAAAASAAAGVPPEAGRAFSGRSAVAVEHALPSAAAPWLAVCASKEPPGSSGAEASARRAEAVRRASAAGSRRRTGRLRAACPYSERQCGKRFKGCGATCPVVRQAHSVGAWDVVRMLLRVPKQ